MTLHNKWCHSANGLLITRLTGLATEAAHDFYDNWPTCVCIAAASELYQTPCPVHLGMGIVQHELYPVSNETSHDDVQTAIMCEKQVDANKNASCIGGWSSQGFVCDMTKAPRADPFRLEWILTSHPTPETSVV